MKRAKKSYKTKYYNLYWNESLQQRIRFAYCIFVFTNLKRNSCTSVSKKVICTFVITSGKLHASTQLSYINLVVQDLLNSQMAPKNLKKFCTTYIYQVTFFLCRQYIVFVFFSMQQLQQQKQKIMQKQSSNVQIFFAVVTLQ